MGKILVAGGAGYVGSHAVIDLIESGYEVIVLDNLKEGHAEAVTEAELVTADINDDRTLADVFSNNSIDAVMHFAAYTYVGESVENPSKYYNNNVAVTLKLLDKMRKHDVRRFIFSSTCATFGDPIYVPIDEKHPQAPINPYGATKLMVERILDDYCHAYGLQYAALRYFNAAGAHPSGKIGESHRIETHLIPLVLQTLTGMRESIKIFGTDYDTPDGTCVRDYIHVCDLATAHRIALNKLKETGESYKINLGTGVGNSVKEVIAACEEVTGKKVPVLNADRRPGDPPYLVAANGLAREILDFRPKYTDIRDTIQTAWQWEQARAF